MRCPTLSELPPPPPGKTGWPWTEESLQLPDTMPDGRPWPKISIVTPNYNYGQFIEETIRSVLLQGYPNLEYIIIDGGSTDNSVEIIKKYEPWLAYWTSEPDRGQAHAINKGFGLATGELIAYLNSDDLYLRGALANVAKYFIEHPDVGAIYGDCQVIDEASDTLGIRRPPNFCLKRELLCNFIPQPTVFLRRAVFKSSGFLDTNLKYAMDYELWCRVGLHAPFEKLPLTIACFRKHHQSKTTCHLEAFGDEAVNFLKRFFARPDLPESIRQQREKSLAHAWMYKGFRELRSGLADEFLQSLSMALELYPRIRGRAARILIRRANAFGSVEVGEQFLDVLKESADKPILRKTVNLAILGLYISWIYRAGSARLAANYLMQLSQKVFECPDIVLSQIDRTTVCVFGQLLLKLVRAINYHWIKLRPNMSFRQGLMR